jgi:Tfp pilus assembly protein PilP
LTVWNALKFVGLALVVFAVSACSDPANEMAANRKADDLRRQVEQVEAEAKARLRELAEAEATRSKMPLPWRTTPRPAQLSSTIAGATR